MKLSKRFIRKTGVRDSKLIIIATEGEKTERNYFNGIAFSDQHKNSRVHVEVLERPNGGSDPKNCLLTLNRFKSTYSLNKHDQLWLVCDVDRWGAKKLAEVNTLCKQKGYRLAVSNPCFEIWLLLHHVKGENLSTEERSAMLESCDSVATKIRASLGSYNKANLKIEDFITNLELAMQESELLDNPAEDWPNTIGTKVFVLMKSILGQD